MKIKLVLITTIGFLALNCSSRNIKSATCAKNNNGSFKEIYEYMTSNDKSQSATLALIEENWVMLEEEQKSMLLEIAEGKGMKDIIQFLSDMGVEKPEKSQESERENRGLKRKRVAEISHRSNRMFRAVKSKKLDMINYLIESGEKIEDETNNPLHRAVADGNLEAVSLLISRGADPYFEEGTKNAIELSKALLEEIKEDQKLGLVSEEKLNRAKEINRMLNPVQR